MVRFVDDPHRFQPVHKRPQDSEQQQSKSCTAESAPDLRWWPATLSRPVRQSDHVLADEKSVPRGHETILVAEDDPFVRSSVILRIESLGYSVVAAVNGNDALLKLRANPAIDMLFTDIVMPGGMNGWELADKAREIRPGLPVVYSSGYALEMLAQQGRAPAQSIILVKPYRKVELAERLREALTAKIMIS